MKFEMLWSTIISDRKKYRKQYQDVYLNFVKRTFKQQYEKFEFESIFLEIVAF